MPKANQTSYRWSKLTREQKDLYVTVLWLGGYSDNAISDFLKAPSKNAIVGYRHHHLPELVTGHPDRASLKQEVPRAEILRDLLDFHAIRELEKQGVVAIAPVTREAAPPNPRFATETERIARTGRKSKPKKKKRAAKRKPKDTSASDVAAQTAPAPEVPTEMPLAETDVVSDEPSKGEDAQAVSGESTEAAPAAAEVSAEVSSPAIEEIPEVEAPQMQPRAVPFSSARALRNRFEAEKVEVVTTCQWPSARGVPCGNDVVPGHKFCEMHFRKLGRYLK